MQEFSSISVSSFEAGSLADQLTQKSREGWEVTAIIPTGTTVTAYLSRAADGTEGADDVEVDLSDALVAEAVADAEFEAELEDELTAEIADEVAYEEVVAEVAAEEGISIPEAEAEVDEAIAEEIVAEELEQSSTDDIAALAAAVAAEADEPAPADIPEDEPGGWALGDSGAATTEAAEEPTVVADEPIEEPTAVEPAAVAETTAAASTSAAPAGWYADPSGRFELRYWDGSQWTEHVSRAGQQFTDPPVA